MGYVKDVFNYQERHQLNTATTGGVGNSSVELGKLLFLNWDLHNCPEYGSDGWKECVDSCRQDILGMNPKFNKDRKRKILWWH